MKNLFHKTHVLIVISSLLICQASPALAAMVYNVPPGQSIQHAIDIASYGDTINVAAGYYTENITLKNGVALIGAGADITTIDGNTSTVVESYSCDPNTILDGFTITNGASRRAGGMYISDGDMTVKNCDFTNNTAHSGGGMAITGSDVIITNCSFSNNLANLSSNQSGGGGAMKITNSDVIITNCSFSNNLANPGDGGAILIRSGSQIITNSTFSNNIANGFNGGGGIYIYNGSQLITNCILWNNTPDQISGGSPLVNYSDIEGGYVGIGNILTDPLFASASDLHPQTGSQCIDAGSNSAVDPSITTDLDGLPRFADDPGTLDTGIGTPPIVDMGAYELSDSDADGVRNEFDNCPYDANPGQSDSDGDGNGDACDICPDFDDYQDTDEDTVPDGCDLCPGFDDSADVDADSIPDICDNCLFEPNPDQADSDSDGLGDQCDLGVTPSDIALMLDMIAELQQQIEELEQTLERLPQLKNGLKK